MLCAISYFLFTFCCCFYCYCCCCRWVLIHARTVTIKRMSQPHFAYAHRLYYMDGRPSCAQPAIIHSLQCCALGAAAVGLQVNCAFERRCVCWLFCWLCAYFWRFGVSSHIEHKTNTAANSNATATHKGGARRREIKIFTQTSAAVGGDSCKSDINVVRVLWSRHAGIVRLTGAACRVSRVCVVCVCVSRPFPGVHVCL